MRIIIVSSKSADSNVASSSHYSTLIKGFIHNGVDAMLLVLGGPKVDQDISGIYQNIPYKYLFRFKSSINLFNRIYSRLCHARAIMRFLEKEMRENESPVLILPSDNCKTIKTLSSFCVRNNIPFVLNRTEAPNGWDKRTSSYIKLMKIHYKYVRNMFVETPQLMEIYSKICDKEANISVVQTVIDCDDIEAFPKEECKPYIAFCGVISNEQKDGLLTLINAFKILSIEHSDLSFYIVGGSATNSHSYLEDIKKEIIKQNLSDKVILTGRVDRSQYVKYLKNALVLLNAKKKDSFNAYGISSKVIEYLYSGNPVVMSDADDLSNQLVDGKDVVLVKNDDAKEFYFAIHALLSDRQYSYEIGVNGYKVAKQIFDYRNETKKVIRILKSISYE